MCNFLVMFLSFKTKMKNYLPIVTAFLLWWVLGFLVQPQQTIVSDVEADLNTELEEIALEVEGTEGEFNTQSALTPQEKKQQNLIKQEKTLQKSYDRTKESIMKLENRLATIKTKLDTVKDKLWWWLSLYVCKNTGWEKDTSYTGCYAVSWGTKDLKVGQTFCNTSDKTPPVRCAWDKSHNSWSSDTWPKWDHCGNTYTDYDSYMDAYNAAPGCNAAAYTHCWVGYSDYDTYMNAYNANPGCGSLPAWDHCGNTYNDYDAYMAAYNASPSCN